MKDRKKSIKNNIAYNILGFTGVVTCSVLTSSFVANTLVKSSTIDTLESNNNNYVVSEIALNFGELNSMMNKMFIDYSLGNPTNKTLKIATLQTNITTALDIYEESLEDSEDKKSIKTLNTLATEYFNLVNSAIDKLISGNLEGASKVINSNMADISEQIYPLLLNIIDDSSANTNDSIGKINSNIHRVSYVLIVLSIIFSIIGAILLRYFVRSIYQPIVDLKKQTKNLSKGNLNFNVEYSRNDELKEVYLNIEAATSSFKNVISNFNNIVIDPEFNYGKLAESLESFSTDTEQQKQSIKTILTQINNISNDFNSNLDKAMTTKTSILSIQDGISSSYKQLGRILDIMQEIQKSTKDIHDIVKTIDEIAFETNVLAINAAVQASQVQEQGKGFSVVAEEVRRLATRSSDAAKSINLILDSSLNKTNVSYGMVNELSKSLEDITDEITIASSVVSDFNNCFTKQINDISSLNNDVNNSIAISEKLYQKSFSHADNAKQASLKFDEIKEKMNVYKL